MKELLGIILVIILFCNCAMRKAANKSETVDQAEKGLINENFDPLILNDDDIKIKKRKPIEAKSDVDDSIIRDNEETENYRNEVQGYRVQICAVSDEQSARDIQREAILKFNEDVYLKYDSPYYKVRIGDCVTRFEADKLQKLAVQKGFDDAWVVKTKVKPKPKSELEEDSISAPNKNK